MRLSAFDLEDPVPELNQPHALAIIRAWTDVSGVGIWYVLFGGLPCAKELGNWCNPEIFSTSHIPRHNYQEKT